MRIFIKKIFSFTILLSIIACNFNTEDTKDTEDKKKATYFIRAKNLFLDHDFVESAKLLSEILDKTPKFTAARILLSKCFFILGNSDRSIEELELALNNMLVINSNSDSSILIAMNYIASISPQLSRKNLEIGIAAGRSYIKKNKNTRHSKKIEINLLELKQLDNPFFAMKMSENFIQNKNTEQALIIYEKILKIYPNCFSALYNQGIAFILSEKKEYAFNSWNNAFGIDPYHSRKLKLEKRLYLLKQNLKKYSNTSLGGARF